MKSISMQLRCATVGMLFLSACATDVPSGPASAGKPSYSVDCENYVPLFSSGRIGAEGTIEAQGTLNSGCGYYVMTGMGGTITNDDVVTLVLMGRAVYPDGTMGPQTSQFFGSAPSTSLELSAEIPQGYAVTGVGVNQRQNDLAIIELKYRQVTVVNGSLSLVGPTYTLRRTKITGDQSAPEISYQLSGDHQVFVGAGFGAWNEDVNKMTWFSGWLE